MNSKKLLLSFVLLVLLLLIPTQAAANGVIIPDPIPFPACGNFTLSLVGDLGEPPYVDENIQWVVEAPTAALISSNGWQLVEIEFVGEPVNTIITFPPGTTKFILPPSLPNGMTIFYDLLIRLKKSCACRPTGRYVYTLLGNYPCNLITVEETIPARFLNPEYTSALCDLPDQNHAWNGEWVKHKEVNCGDYLKGGNFYDTRH